MIKTKVIYSNLLERDIEIRIKRANKESGIYLYFLDGQNIFDKESSTYNKSWEVDKVCDELGLDVNIIGISSLKDEARQFEYNPYYIENDKIKEMMGDKIKEDDPKGKLTARFIVEELMPQVEKEPASDRLIGGSSMGGIMSLYIGAQYPLKFNKILAMSTAGFISPQELKEDLMRYKLQNNQRVYIDCGTKETEDEYVNLGYLTYNREYNTLLDNRVQHEYVEEEGGIHDEISWNRRLPNALRWLFNL